MTEKEIIAADQVAEIKRFKDELSTIESIDAERKRLSGLLHSNVGQLLVGAGLKSQLLSSRLETVNPSLAREAKLQGELVKQALDQIRLIARGLLPVTETEESFQVLLSRFCNSTELLSGIKCNCTFDETVDPIVGDKGCELFSIAQEAITNAFRHSKTTQIDISLSQELESVHLSITDYGCGLSEDKATLGCGTTVIKHRAQHLGGYAEIGPAESGGVRVFVSIPLD